MNVNLKTLHNKNLTKNLNQHTKVIFLLLTLSFVWKDVSIIRKK